LRTPNSIAKLLGFFESLKIILLKAQVSSGSSLYYVGSFPLVVPDAGAYPVESLYECKLNYICDMERINQSYAKGRGSIHPDKRFSFLRKLQKNILSEDFGLIVSFSEIKKDKFDLLEFNTVHCGLTTNEISKIKKYTISPAY
jgi:hypothetical protein